MIASVAALVGIVGLLIGNLLTRSLEYRKWLRAERHKACAQLLEASDTSIWPSRYHRAVPQGLKTALAETYNPIHEVLRSRMGWLAKLFLNWFARRSDSASDEEQRNETVEGLISSLVKKAEPAAIDIISERLGAGKTGRLTLIREGIHRINVARESVELICPAVVVVAGRKLFQAAITLIEADPESENEEWEAKSKDYDEARESFVVAARKDLVRRGWPKHLAV